MDLFPRRESLEKCSADSCAPADSEDSTSPNPLQAYGSDSTIALKNCVKELLIHGETNDLAHELIGSSLTFVDPQAASDNLSQQASLKDTLVELSSLNGLLPNKLAGANISLARLDLAKLSTRLPAEENNFRLEALDEQWQLYLRVLYSITAIVSILLNLITVIVLYRAKPSELRKYLINLAIGDLFMSCFSIPFTYTEYMLGYWDYPPILCPVVKFVVTLAVYVSVCTMVVIGVNRHVAILYPMKKCSERVWKCSKNSVICGIWLSGIIISSPEYLMFDSTQFCYNRRYLHDCRNIWGERFSYYYTVFIYLTTFVIPFMLLCYLYSSIGIQLKHREMPGNADASRDLTMQTKRAKVVKMLIVVVVVFAIFWLPLQTFSLIMFLWPAVRQVNYDSFSYNIFVGTYFTFHWMSVAHSCLNPLIYCFMNPKFRKDLRDLLCGLRWPGAGGARGGRLFRRRHYFDSYSTTTVRAHQQSAQSGGSKGRPGEPVSSCVRLKLAALEAPARANGKQPAQADVGLSEAALASKSPMENNESAGVNDDDNDNDDDGTGDGDARLDHGDEVSSRSLGVGDSLAAPGANGLWAARAHKLNRRERFRGPDKLLLLAAKKSIEIATLPEVDEDEEEDDDGDAEDEDEEEEDQEDDEAAREVAGRRGVAERAEIGPAQLEAGAGPAGTRAATSNGRRRRQQQCPTAETRGHEADDKLVRRRQRPLGQLARLLHLGASPASAPPAAVSSAARNSTASQRPAGGKANIANV